MGVSLARDLAVLFLSTHTALEEGALTFYRGSSSHSGQEESDEKKPWGFLWEGKKWRKWCRGSWPTSVVGELCGKIWGVSSFSFKGEIHPTLPLLCYTTALVPKSFRCFGKCCPKCPLLLIKISGYQRFLVGKAERALAKLHFPCLWHEQSLLCECGVVFIPGPSIILWVTENTIYFHLYRP